MTATNSEPGGGEETILAWWWRRAAVRSAEHLTALNRQLTSLTGVLLIPLLALVFLTGLAMDMYWHVHYVIGFVLIPVVALKVAATGYRAISYYLGRKAYRAAGPPELSLRLLAPVIVISTITALVTGVALWAQHSRSGTLSTLHTDSAVICAGTVGIHVLAYLPRALVEAGHAMRATLSRVGAVRVATVMLVLVAGVALAAMTYSTGTWPAREHRPFNLTQPSELKVIRSTHLSRPPRGR